MKTAQFRHSAFALLLSALALAGCGLKGSLILPPTKPPAAQTGTPAPTAQPAAQPTPADQPAAKTP